jgi:hypothetical protein
MSHRPDIGGWIFVAGGLALGPLAGWIIDAHLLSENSTRMGGYTVIVFSTLTIALRPAWKRLQFWVDLLVLLALHGVLLLLLLHLLDVHSIRLNWALALPVVAIEVLFALGVLWRRNVT